MIHKRSLLKEFKRDKRPLHTCMTQWEDICRPTQTDLKIIQYLNEQVDKGILFNTHKLYKHPDNLIHLKRYHKLELPDDPQT